MFIINTIYNAGTVVQSREQTSYSLSLSHNPAYDCHQVRLQQDGNSTVQAHESQSVAEVALQSNVIYEQLPE